MNNAGAGFLLVDVNGPDLTAEDKAVLAHPRIGGVILFARNYRSPRQLEQLVREIKSLRALPLLVTVDQEGGRVQRFRDGMTRLPPARALGRAHDRNQQKGLALAHAAGWVMAAELRATGVDLSFAPVVDIDGGISGVIGDRAFHKNPAVVSMLAGAYAEGMAEAGMVACAKHFPGHGGVSADSHAELPLDRREMRALRQHDLVPFRALIQDGVAAVMTAHVRYEQADREPASLSRFWNRNVLRGELAFEGAVFCDDLSMNGAAVAGDYPARAAAALRAGCDMLPVCNNRAAVMACLEADLPDAAHGAARRLARLRGRDAVSWDALQHSARWESNRRALADINVDTSNKGPLND